MVSEDYRPTIICPFTGIIVIDQDGYHEPFPETLIHYYVDNDYFQLESLEIAINNLICLIDDTPFTNKERRKLFKNIKPEFPWFNDESFYPSAIVRNHPLIHTLEDWTNYGNIGTDAPYCYSFCSVDKIPIVLNDFKRIYEIVSNHPKVQEELF